nr:PREDICTED: binding partner of ACD11 1-like isoform X3 [Nicotiana tabacum]
MYLGHYAAEVTSLSPKATEKDVYEFFSHCGEIELVEIIRLSEYASIAYVTFEDTYALENAILLSVTHTNEFISTPGEAVTMAQHVVETMIVKGYELSKDALTKAKAFDESYQVSSTAVAKGAELSKRVGLTDRIQSGMETVKSVDEKYHLSELTMSAVSFTGKTAVAAATTVVNSSYFSKGALWVSDALNRAAKVAADLGNNGVKKETVPLQMD